MADFAHAWIGWQNLFYEYASTAQANNETAGFPAANAATWFTWQRWKGVDGVSGDSWTVRIDCGIPRAVNYAAIAGHTLDGHQIKVQGSNDDTTWNDVFVLTPDATTLLQYNGVPLYNGVYYYNGVAQIAAQPAYGPNNMSGRFPLTTYRYWRYWFGAGPATAPQVGVLALGVALDFPTGFYGGFQRPNWNELVQVTNSISERGAFLGRSSVRAGVRPFKVALSYVSHDWVRDNWQPFKDHADLLPFFFVWEPVALDHVNGTRNNTDCVYAWGQAETATLKNKRHANVAVSCEGSLK